MTDLFAQPRARLFTTFGTVLYVDVTSGELRHGQNESSPANAVLVTDEGSSAGSRSGRLMHEVEGPLQPIVCSSECSYSSVSANAPRAAGPTQFQLVQLERGCVGLQSEGLYLCAEPGGRITLSRLVCSGWECFLPSEDWCTAFPAAQEYEFTADWFSGHTPVWTQLIEQLKPTRILEIGSFEGRSTCYLMENCSKIAPVEIYCVDTWEGGVEHDKNAMGEVERRFDHNVTLAKQRASHAASVRKLKKTSTQALAEIVARREAPFDLIYVDGSHQAPDVLTDAVLAFQLLRIGGIMIFDDYLWRLGPDGKQDPLNMPKPAIDSFINIFQRKLRIIGGLPIYQLYIEKLFS